MAAPPDTWSPRSRGAGAAGRARAPPTGLGVADHRRPRPPGLRPGLAAPGPATTAPPGATRGPAPRRRLLGARRRRGRHRRGPWRLAVAALLGPAPPRVGALGLESRELATRRPRAGRRTGACPTRTGSAVPRVPAPPSCRCRRRVVGALLLEAALDHLEGKEVLALLAQHPAQPLDVVLVELAVPRRRPFGVDETLALEEADLGDGDVGELLAQQREHVADRQVRPAAHGVPPRSLTRRPPPGRRA